MCVDYTCPKKLRTIETIDVRVHRVRGLGWGLDAGNVREEACRNADILPTWASSAKLIRLW
jgi:hypothetical protein